MTTSRPFSLNATLALSLIVSAGVLAAQQRPRVIDRANLDTICAACTDFYEFANGGWLKRTTIPPDKSSLGSFGILADQNQEVVQRIVVDDANLVRDGETKAGTNDWKIGNYYLACMDTAALDKLGTRPIQPALTAIAAAKTTDDVVRVMGDPRFAGGGGGGGGGRGGGGGLAPFAMGPSTDPKNSKIIILSANQGGLVLTRDDYLQTTDRATKRRADYLDHITRSFHLLGESDTQASTDAQAVLDLETSIAKITIPQADMRDPVATYHKMPLADFQQTTPHIEWTRYLQAHHAGGSFDVNVRAPMFFKAIDSLLAATPVETWQTYMRWHALNGAMGSLSAPFRHEAFRWQQVTTGVQQQQARMKQCSSQTNAALGEAVGQDWIKRNFTPAAKQRAVVMVNNLIAALGDRIRSLDWMSADTKTQAIAKLDAFLKKVAYPDKWRDYSTLTVTPGAFYQNERTVAEWNQARTWSRLGQAPPRDEWSMTPPTVNASYSSSLNQIQFPAGILQPPFFDANADDPVNYGALGAVIGHEMTHGFDNSGREFDAQGNLRDWWTPEDAAKYNVAAQKIVDQFNGYTVVDSTVHVNGKQTLGENIADLGGLTVAYAAMEKALDAKGPSARRKIDGFTPEQRFFLAWAQIWRSVSRDQQLIQQVKTDAHAPARWRVNGPLSNMPEFAKAWGCKEGDPMVRPDSLRARIW